MKALYTIRKPVVTEKSTQMQEKGIYAFWVSSKATKIDVKQAVKELYGADVSAVKMVKVPAKFRAIRKGNFNKRSETVKAYVTLKNRSKLDLNKFEKSDKEVKVKLASAKAEKKPAAKKTAKKSTK